MVVRTARVSNKLIVTHPGQAHADEFIACALLMATHKHITRIERRDPTPEELEDPDILVVDVGGRYEPALGNYDHHQGGPEVEGRCAFDLVIEELGFSDVAKAASSWTTFKSSIDCYGPYATGRKYGMSSDAVFASLSPIETALLRQFEAETKIGPGMYLWFFMQKLGEGLLEYWGEFAPQLQLAQDAPVIQVNGLTFIDFRGVDCGNAAKNAVLNERQAAGSIMVDDRGEGCEDRVILYRHADNQFVDFRRITEPMHYVHQQNGFLAKTLTGVKATEDVTRLLEQAIVSDAEQLQKLADAETVSA